MKNIINAVLYITLFSSIGCSKVLDINNNPNNISSFTNDNQLAGTLLTSGRHQVTTLNELGAFWSGHWAKASDIAGTAAGGTQSSLDMTINYTIVSSFANSVWEDQYVILYNMELLYQQSVGTAPAYAGMARIVQGLHYMQISDYYNNVPFSEALKPTNPSPAYDKGLDVYKGAINLISEGISLLKNAGSTPTPSTSDILFAGNVSRWIQLGNTIKLRGLLQLSNVSSAEAFVTEELAKITAEGSGYLTADALFNPGFSKNANQQSPFWNTYYMTYAGNITTLYNAVRPTRFLVEKYQQYNDPRLSAIYKDVNGEYVGASLGSNSADETAAKTSAFKVGGLLKTETASALYFSAAESYFVQAEAAQRGWISGTVADLYENGIKASMTYLGVGSEQQLTYLAQDAVKLSSSDDKMATIIEQKWLALNGIDGHAAFNDFRRLGLPANVPGSISYSASGNAHPNRLLYPTSEQSANSSRVAAEGEINPMSDKIFWQ